MWKKEEESGDTPQQRPRATSEPERSDRADSPSPRATIGRSITIKGEVTGDEDLLIQGRIEGSINLEQHSVTVGAEGDVKASITGRVVTVEGKVVGDLKAEEQVILMGSAEVEGDITAPRVVLEDGARLRGGVDMGDRGRAPKAAGLVRSPQPGGRSFGSEPKPAGAAVGGSSNAEESGEDPKGPEKGADAAKTAAGAK